MPTLAPVSVDAHKSERGGADPLAPEVTLRPEPRDWARLARERFATLSDGSRAARAALGWPTDRPIIMSGHQAEIWHAGIVAKIFAMDTVAKQVGGAAAWITVDQDEHEALLVRYPVVRKDGRIEARDWRLSGPRGRDEAIPGLAPALRSPSDVPVLGAGERFLTGDAGAALSRIRAAVLSHADASSASAQVTSAAFDLLRPVRPKGDALQVGALQLGHTDAFRQLVDRMVRDPDRAAAAYNAGLEADGSGRVAALAQTHGSDPASIELPLWRIERGARRRATVEDARAFLKAGPGGEVRLAPRALPMTGLLRLHLCDLFVHGLGGERYDRATERWFNLWLKEDLAPTVVASANVYLEIGGELGRVSPRDAAHAAWMAHRASHDPGLLNDARGAAGKQAILEEIADLKRRKRRDPAAARELAGAFRRLHELLATTRAAHAQELAGLAAAAEEARAAVAGKTAAFDRTWPFPLHGEARLKNLRVAVETRFRG